MEEGIRGWKCADWIWRPIIETKWFCKTVCPFGRNGIETIFFSCDRDRKELLEKIKCCDRTIY